MSSKWIWIVLLVVVVGFIVWIEHVSNQNVATAGRRRLRAGRGLARRRRLVGVSKSHCLGLKLRVHPPGAAAFERTLDVNVKDRWASRVQPGQWVSVILLRDPPGAIGLDLDAFAAPAPQPPASAVAQ